MLRVLDLFSGIGGFSLGLERTGGFTTVAFCEIDPYCQAVLRKHWPGVPIFDDVRTLSGVECDVICGGFPCQPFSTAGARLGEEDNRHLWPEYRRLIKASRPTWVIGENVIGLADMALDSVLDDLDSLGYTARPFDIPAVSLGADHERRRLWIIAHANEHRLEKNANNALLRPQANHAWDAGLPCSSALSVGSQWQGAPPSGTVAVGVDDGVPARVDRLRALGNAVVPQIPEIIGRAILEAEAA